MDTHHHNQLTARKLSIIAKDVMSTNIYKIVKRYLMLMDYLPLFHS